MMKKMTKAIFFGLLFLIVAIQFLNANYFLGIVLFSLNCYGLVVFEKRETIRLFYSAIEKLYICVDYDAFIFKYQFLERNRLMAFISSPTIMLLNAIGHYHSGNKARAATEINELSCQGHLLFWKNAYEAMLTQKDSYVENMEALIVDIPQKYVNLSRQRLGVLQLATRSKNDKERVSKLRTQVEAHLLIAELSLMMANLETDQRLKNYHLLVAKNLSKKCIL